MYGVRALGRGRRMRARTGAIRTTTITSKGGRPMKAIGIAMTTIAIAAGVKGIETTTVVTTAETTCGTIAVTTAATMATSMDAMVSRTAKT